MTGEGREEFKAKKNGPGMKKSGGEGGGAQSVRGNYKRFYGDKSDGCGRSASVYHVYPVSRITGEGREGCSKGSGREEAIPTALCRIYV